MFTGCVLHAGLEMLPVMSVDISLQGWLQYPFHALTPSPMHYDSATPPVHWWNLFLFPLESGPTCGLLDMGSSTFKVMPREAL